MKSKNRNGATAQAQAGWHFSEYILKVIQRLFNYPTNMNVEYRSLIFTTNSNTRFSTNIRKEEYTILEGCGLKSRVLKAGEDCHLDSLCF